MRRNPDRSRTRRAMICLTNRGGYIDMMLRGIVAYAKEHPQWLFVNAVAGKESLVRDKLSIPGIEGLLTQIRDEDDVTALREWGKPVVLLEQDPVEPFPAVRADNRAVGRMAFEHLAGCGLKTMAYLGVPSERYSRDREQAFVHAALEAGLRVLVAADSPCTHAERLPVPSSPYDRFVDALPRPVGLFTDNSWRAEQVACECLARNIAVPEEIALLGVDEDELLCEGCIPRLSSLDQGTFQIGYRAADLLHRMMLGQDPPAGEILVPPSHIVERQSTSIMAVEDPLLQDALSFIRESACGGIDVGDVVDELKVSRRRLETLFRDKLGRSIHDSILRTRLDRVKQLLTETNMPIADIAEATGFGYPTNMSKAFRRLVKMTPRAYRQQMRQV